MSLADSRIVDRSGLYSVGREILTFFFVRRGLFGYMGSLQCERSVDEEVGSYLAEGGVRELDVPLSQGNTYVLLVWRVGGLAVAVPWPAQRVHVTESVER